MATAPTDAASASVDERDAAAQSPRWPSSRLCLVRARDSPRALNWSAMGVPSSSVEQLRKCVRSTRLVLARENAHERCGDAADEVVAARGGLSDLSALCPGLNGDGVGDLRGILQQLDYVASLGVHALMAVCRSIPR